MNTAKPTNLPIPRLGRSLNTAKLWYCESNEYCTWDGIELFSCAGHGDTPEEAYADWFENYQMFRYYEEGFG